MGWAVGTTTILDSRHGWVKRDIGYGVPAQCDHPDCTEEIDRGLAYRCGDIHDDDGCGLYFCHKHGGGGLCERCENEQPSFDPSPDSQSTLDCQGMDASWADWRAENGYPRHPDFPFDETAPWYRCNELVQKEQEYEEQKLTWAGGKIRLEFSEVKNGQKLTCLNLANVPG